MTAGVGDCRVLVYGMALGDRFSENGAPVLLNEESKTMTDRYDTNPEGFLDKDLIETRIDGGTAYEGSFFSIQKDNVRLPDGAVAFREFMHHPGAATIIPLFDDGTVLVERQFRYPMNRIFIELPAGKIDQGEDPFETAKRELEEETGYVADEWYFVTTIHNAIGYSDEHIDLYLAKGLRQGKVRLDEEEFIQSFRISAIELIDWVKKGQVTDVKTIIGTFWLEKIVSGQWNVEKMV